MLFSRGLQVGRDSFVINLRAVMEHVMQLVL